MLQPVPTQACLLCTAKLVKMEGRKMFLEASISDTNTEAKYVDSTTLFINMKNKLPQSTPSNAADSTTESSQPTADIDTGPKDISQWHSEPRYVNLLKDIGL